MPWKTRDLIGARGEFVQLAELGQEAFSSLCESFGISRTTGYKWLARYRESGRRYEALNNQSRRPHQSPTQIGQDVVANILSARARHGSGAYTLTSLLRAEGVKIGHSTINRILRSRALTRTKDPNAASWLAQMLATTDPGKLTTDLSNVPTLSVLNERVKRGSIRDRKKSIAVLARLRGIPLNTICASLDLTPHTVIAYSKRFAAGGTDLLFSPRPTKINDEQHKSRVLALLHSPPSSCGINRTTWKMEDLHRVLKQEGMNISENRIRRIIRAAGFRWQVAKEVLTSSDPKYREKVSAIKSILSDLGPTEAFFSIDEYGPFAIKKKGGRKRVAPGDRYVVPQWQKSKGWMILTAALELSTNQVTHFYSRTKDTDEMIKMADLLRTAYRRCTTIYLSWDAASWHVSKKLTTHLADLNRNAALDGHPIVKTAPLPAGAQFLNVIESVFSGMSRAIIRNSDYPSVETAKTAIDRYFVERNKHFLNYPKRAGDKIWGKERVPSEFQEGQNCKDPEYR